MAAVRETSDFKIKSTVTVIGFMYRLVFIVASDFSAEAVLAPPAAPAHLLVTVSLVLTTCPSTISSTTVMTFCLMVLVEVLLDKEGAPVLSECQIPKYICRR